MAANPLRSLQLERHNVVLENPCKRTSWSVEVSIALNFLEVSVKYKSTWWSLAVIVRLIALAEWMFCGTLGSLVCRKYAARFMNFARTPLRNIQNVERIIRYSFEASDERQQI
jgi:hypothetical protein